MRSSLDGMLITDTDLALGTYNYYLYMSSGVDGKYIVMRENAAETEYRYAFGLGSAATVDWANKANLKYVTPNQLSGRG